MSVVLINECGDFDRQREEIYLKILRLKMRQLSTRDKCRGGFRGFFRPPPFSGKKMVDYIGNHRSMTGAAPILGSQWAPSWAVNRTLLMTITGSTTEMTQKLESIGHCMTFNNEQTPYCKFIFKRPCNYKCQTIQTRKIMG